MPVNCLHIKDLLLNMEQGNYLRRPISRLIIKEELSKGKILKVGLDEANELTWDIH